MTQNDDNRNSIRLDRIENKVDDLQERLNDNHVETLNRIEKLSNDMTTKVYTVEAMAVKHEQHFSTLNKIFFSGGIISLLAFFKDFLHK